MFKLEIQKFILFCCNKNHNLEHEVLSEVVVKTNRSNSNQTPGTRSDPWCKRHWYFEKGALFRFVI